MAGVRVDGARLQQCVRIVAEVVALLARRPRNLVRLATAVRTYMEALLDDGCVQNLECQPDCGAVRLPRRPRPRPLPPLIPPLHLA